MASPSSGGSLSYVPTPVERPYFEGLFAAADTQGGGQIGGAQAVPFFQRSQLPTEALRNIWTIADQPPTNALDHRKFAVAIRLIQLLQNGKQGEGPTLQAPQGVDLRPVYFEGISGVSVPLPSMEQQQHPHQPQPQIPPVQQQPHPQQQQQYPQQQHAHHTPPRPPSSASQYAPPVQQQQQPPRPPPSTSMALTPQDPYTLPPNEQARYESIFAEYTQPDGFVHGKEAVALFSKSGLPQTQLASIWNMVDTPVDNKLDKVEFAIAMHLIVCISKKNLPMPPSLPLSLKQLKSQAPPPTSMQTQLPTGATSSQGLPYQQEHQQHQPQQQQIHRTMTNDAGSVASVPPPPVISGGPPRSIQLQPQSQQPPPSGLSVSASLQGPPPLPARGEGALSISDAFEGLSVDGAAGSSFLPQTLAPASFGAPNNLGTTASFDNASHASNTGAVSDVGGGIPSPGRNAASSFAMGPPAIVTATSPAPAPKTTQQLASSYSMGDSTQELEKLKDVLQKLQAENIALKAQLGTMTGDEKDVLKQLGATVAEISTLSNELTTVRAQVLASKSRLVEATAELQAAKEKKSVVKDLISEASETKSAIQQAHTGVEEAIEMAKAPPPAANGFDGDLFDFGGAAPAPSGPVAQDSSYASNAESMHPNPITEPPAYQNNQVLKTVASNDSEYGQLKEAVLSTDTFNSSYGEASKAGLSNYASHYGQLETVTSYESNQSDGGPGHNRTASAASLGFDSSMVMGGAPLDYSTGSTLAGPPPPTDRYQGKNADDHNSTPSIGDVNELRRRAKEAEDVARDAEESRQQVAAQVEELRRVADEAEAEARKHLAGGDGKKKKVGMLGRGKKRDAKEGERLALEAKTKKDTFLQAQSQANDAQALALDTKREADRLRQQAEEAEINAASAASMQHSQPVAPSQQPSNGYPAPAATPAYGTGMGQQPQYGGTSFGGQYNPNVMGSGGVEIPTPSGGEDPYSNPFG